MSTRNEPCSPTKACRSHGVRSGSAATATSGSRSWPGARRLVNAVMLALAMDSRDAVDAMNRAATANGGQADVNPVQDLGFMYSRDLADPDGHLWGAFWMDPAAIPRS